MKLIFLSLISIFTLIGYVKVGAVGESKLSKDDNEFKQLMTDFNKTLEHNKVVQVQADEAKEKLIVATTNKIVQLSTENKALKTELNEIKAKLDSVSIDTSSSFMLLPISKG
jgi:hydroxymethylpyrimidine pyrophosphatase-like HAD family hydrolase